MTEQTMILIIQILLFLIFLCVIIGLTYEQYLKWRDRLND